jgi:hypothetical protein
LDVQLISRSSPGKRSSSRSELSPRK